MLTKKYLKKVIVSDEASSAEGRGERLRKIRNLANLSRKELCDSSELKLFTYKSWELGRFGGLPLDGAEKVIRRVSQENVICTLEWLLYNQGPEPCVVSMPGQNNEDDEAILKEIMIFQSLYQDGVFFRIKDDALAPQFILSDYVAGIKYFPENMNKALNQICIVQLSNGEILCRYLRENNGSYQLLATNIDSRLASAPIMDAELAFAAPIIRHYKSI